MTMTELQEILSKHVEAVDKSASMKAVERQVEIENATVIAGLANTMIKNVSMQLKAEQMGTTLGGLIK